MREILFRGKRIDNGEWVCGGIVQEKEYAAITIYSYYHEWHDFEKVDLETVGQFTGLTDKNGKKIFEGDIFKFDGERFVCRWDEGNIEFGASNKKESMGMAYFPRGEVEVIGNIHDNPELLEGEEK